MLKKSATKKFKSVIYPVAFILIVILSAVYKYVFKGSGDITLQGFKSGKTASVTETTAPDDLYHETDIQVTVQDTAPATVETVRLISVYICGEVRNPGIYEAPRGVMLNDIIEDAGGLTENASVNNINLVYQITGNMSIYIPSEDEIKNGFTGGDIIRQDGVYVWGNSSGGSSDPGGSTLMVNINTAALDELKSLPGIGEVTAQAIIDYRNTTPFSAIEDIKNVTGIGDSKFNRIKDYICV
ncbi:MAG: helix-hairpin-helix domain-containing protein [Eubacteriales bacterium]|nr:helix-hairpin-helix domain-containing protein [Eubacteriales bacterium]